MNVLLDSDYYPNQPQALLGEPALRKTAEWLDDLNHHPLIVRALSEIEESSTQHKYYHNLQHTLEVMADAIHFAVLEQCYDSEIELLALAAAFHDIGHSQDPAIHEEISAEYAQIRMRKFGYSATEMATVENLILDLSLIHI